MPTHDHLFAKLACENKLCIQIYLNHFVPVFIRMIRRWLPQNRTRIIHQYIDLSDICFHLCDKSPQSISVGKITCIRAKPAAQSGNIPLHLTPRRQRCTHPHNIGTCLGQPLGKSATNTAPTPRHQCRLTAQIKLIQNSHHGSSRLTVQKHLHHLATRHHLFKSLCRIIQRQRIRNQSFYINRARCRQSNCPLKIYGFVHATPHQM